jgi:anti-sigma regulatory factor (Ser/Thr protein kinase)
VTFVDMAQAGRNPACIIPVWRKFVAAHEENPVGIRGIGEPIWPGRDEAEISECEVHEALLNVAFDGGRPWLLRCPYDAEHLDEQVLSGAVRNHPVIMDVNGEVPSADYPGTLAHHAALHGTLPQAPPGTPSLMFSRTGLNQVRETVVRHARAAGLSQHRTEDLMLAAHEVATNSIIHGGGRGSLRCWVDGRSVICEVRDGGCVRQPLVGREPPSSAQEGGRGVWLANQLCDLVQMRTSSHGTVVRMHMER